MFSWLKRRRRPSRAALLNEGLALAMDWGEDWLAPINARLRERHADLSSAELDELNATCQGAMRRGHEAVYARLQEEAEAPSVDALASVVRAEYPWVDQENLARLLHQSVYYAAKTGRYARES
jgi:hypothetical protein